MNRRNRGQIRIIEAFLATLVIFSSLAVSANLTVTQETRRQSGLETTGLQALVQLDSDGFLGESIAAGNWSSLREAVALALPTGMVFNVSIYDQQMQQINDEAICNGGFSDQETAFVEYVCACQSRAFRAYVVHMVLGVPA